MKLMQLDSSYLQKEIKKIKKYNYEKERLNKILLHITTSSDFTELRDSYISKMYGFERLKHELNNYYSFNLCKSNKGVIRLIVTIDKNNNIVKIEYISMDHYKYFKNKIK